jgi:hypothetical protein
VNLDRRLMGVGGDDSRYIRVIVYTIVVFTDI